MSLRGFRLRAGRGARNSPGASRGFSFCQSPEKEKGGSGPGPAERSGGPEPEAVWKSLLLGEEGDLVEYLVRVTVIGLGSAAIFFGILAALRRQGGVLIDRIESLGF